MSSLPTTAVDLASTDGVTIRLHDLGGDGPTLLLAHATGFHGRVWAPCASHLTDFHCVAPDFRGHGDSLVPAGVTFAWSGFGDDVGAVLDELQRRGAIPADGLVAAGHSKGGAAILLAEQSRPGTFRSLYLFEPIAFPPMPALPSRDNPMSSAARRRRAVFDSFDAAYENFKSKPPLNALAPDALRAYVDHGFTLQPDGTVQLKCRPEVEAEAYEMGSQHGAYEHLSEVRCPVTIAVGAEIPFTPATFAAAIVDRLPHGRIERHPDLGHFGPLEDPPTIAACIRRAFT